MGEPHFYRHGDLKLRGILERPEKPNGHAILVVHEAPGLGDNARRRTRMLAELGYVALAADLYGGGRTFAGSEAVAQMDQLRGNASLFRARVKAGLDALQEVSAAPPEQCAAVGYCFGGLAVLELARSGAPLGGVVSFHGWLRASAPAAPGAVRARVLACT